MHDDIYIEFGLLKPLISVILATRLIYTVNKSSFTSERIVKRISLVNYFLFWKFIIIIILFLLSHFSFFFIIAPPCTV